MSRSDNEESKSFVESSAQKLLEAKTPDMVLDILCDCMYAVQMDSAVRKDLDDVYNRLQNRKLAANKPKQPIRVYIDSKYIGESKIFNFVTECVPIGSTGMYFPPYTTITIDSKLLEPYTGDTDIHNISVTTGLSDGNTWVYRFGPAAIKHGCDNSIIIHGNGQIKVERL